MTLKRRLVIVLFCATVGSLIVFSSIGRESTMAVVLLLLYPLIPAVVFGTRRGTASALSLVTGFACRLDGNVDFPGRNAPSEEYAGTLNGGARPGAGLCR